jgi:type IV pilus assembly protein PilA
MIVVAIIGILAAIAIPNFLKFQAKSKQSEAKANLGGIFTGQIAYFGEANAFSSFPNINWSPSGTARYHYQLGTFSATLDALNVGAATKFGTTTALSDSADWATNRNGATDNAATLATSHIPYIDNSANPNVFSAGATGVISSSTTQDSWTINQKRILIWTQDGT